MYILGISCYYHDSSAALIKDGKVISAVEEERFTRIKHDNTFPINSIKHCLKYNGITIKDISYIAFYEKPFLKFERVLSQYLNYFPKSYRSFVSTIPSWLTNKLKIIQTLTKKIKYKGPVHFIPHHVSHAASAFYPSPFKNAAILTVDGVGEWATTAYGYGNKNNIEMLKQINFPNSIGLFYSTITAYLGFSVNNSEFKVMGLSAYGNNDRKKNIYYSKLSKLVSIKDDGSFRFDMSYFRFQYDKRMPSDKLCSLLGGPIRKNEKLNNRHKDIAAALQMLTEDILTKILVHVKNETKQDNLVYSGGVALNSVFNGKISQKTGFKKIWIQPSSSDSGTSLGAALFSYHSVLKHKTRTELKHVYLGPDYSNQKIKYFLENKGIPYIQFSSKKKLVKKVAKLIFENNVIGWFNGRMEFGPRALGNRSILANPLNPKMQAIINKKVKHREGFRPFAPVVCKDDISKFFDTSNLDIQSSKFMLMVLPFKKKWHNNLNSVMHIDKTGRLQSINKSYNPVYYDLIKQFGKISKVPILLNTSFNVRGEPIVCSPKDAYNCFMNTQIDYLVIGNFLIRKI